MPDEHHKAIINGMNLALAMIVHELNAKGLVSKNALASQMERAAQQATERTVQKAGGTAAGSRLDLVMLRNLARLLRDPTPSNTRPLRVVDGGRSRQPDVDAAADTGGVAQA